VEEKGFARRIDESNRYHGSGHRVALDIDPALAVLLPIGCVGDGWSIH
jgi:hypothetical protein